MTRSYSLSPNDDANVALLTFDLRHLLGVAQYFPQLRLRRPPFRHPAPLTTPLVRLLPLSIQMTSSYNNLPQESPHLLVNFMLRHLWDLCPSPSTSTDSPRRHLMNDTALRFPASGSSIVPLDVPRLLFVTPADALTARAPHVVGIATSLVDAPEYPRIVLTFIVLDAVLHRTGLFESGILDGVEGVLLRFFLFTSLDYFSFNMSRTRSPLMFLMPTVLHDS